MIRPALFVAALAVTGLGLVASPASASPASAATLAADAADAWRFPAGFVAREVTSPLRLAGLTAAPAPVAAGIVAEPIDTDWRTLLGLNYRTGQTTEALESRRGREVRIPGFMVPFEDGMSGVNEFLLVPYFGACIHTPPPPPNQIVYVRMAGDRRVEVNIWDAVFVVGVLDIESIESPYGTVGHQVLGSAVLPFGR